MMLELVLGSALNETWSKVSDFMFQRGKGESDETRKETKDE